MERPTNSRRLVKATNSHSQQQPRRRSLEPRVKTNQLHQQTHPTSTSAIWTLSDQQRSCTTLALHSSKTRSISRHSKTLRNRPIRWKETRRYGTTWAYQWCTWTRRSSRQSTMIESQTSSVPNTASSSLISRNRAGLVNWSDSNSRRKEIPSLSYIDWSPRRRTNTCRNWVAIKPTSSRTCRSKALKTSRRPSWRDKRSWRSKRGRPQTFPKDPCNLRIQSCTYRMCWLQFRTRSATKAATHSFTNSYRGPTSYRCSRVTMKHTLRLILTSISPRTISPRKGRRRRAVRKETAVTSANTVKTTSSTRCPSSPRHTMNFHHTTRVWSNESRRNTRLSWRTLTSTYAISSLKWTTSATPSSTERSWLANSADAWLRRQHSLWCSTWQRPTAWLAITRKQWSTFRTLSSLKKQSQITLKTNRQENWLSRPLLITSSLAINSRRGQQPPWTRHQFFSVQVTSMVPSSNWTNFWRMRTSILSQKIKEMMASFQLTSSSYSSTSCWRRKTLNSPDTWRSTVVSS